MCNPSSRDDSWMKSTWIWWRETWIRSIYQFKLIRCSRKKFKYMNRCAILKMKWMIWSSKNFWMLKKICWRPLNKLESNEIYKWCCRLSMGLEKKILNGESSCKDDCKMEWQMMNSLRKSRAISGFLNSLNRLESSFQEMKKSTIL